MTRRSYHEPRAGFTTWPVQFESSSRNSYLLRIPAVDPYSIPRIYLEVKLDVSSMQTGIDST